MFWGLIMEPNKSYKQTVQNSFHISMASLEINQMDNDTVSVIAGIENQEFILCNLHKNKALQCPLDLNFKAGDEIKFFTSGQSTVHLTGYLIDDDLDDLLEEEEEDEETGNSITKKNILPGIPSEAETPAKNVKDKPNSQSEKKRKEELSNSPNTKKPKFELQVEEEEEDDEESEESSGEEDELGEEEEGDEDEDSDDESEELETSSPKKPNKTLQMQQNKSPGIQKTPTTQSTQNSLSQQQSSKKKKNNQKQMNTPETPSENGTQQGRKKSQVNTTPTSSESATPQKKVLQGGVAIEDIKTGGGPVAKPGKQVSVYYVGRLKQNNKQFDATTQGPGFKFALGRSEVIKGWDVGVAGMRVGGKRRITCPPHMAYGKKGQPPTIPPNSVLVFDVELRAIN